MESYSYENLFAILQEEKKSGELQQLPKDFYKTTAKYIQRHPYENTAARKQEENFGLLMTKLKERRKQKILIYLAYKKQLPPRSPDEDIELYSKLKKDLEEESEQPRLYKVKISEDTPELVSPGGNKVGPYNKNQIIETANKPEAEFIVENKLGEML